MGRVGWEWLVVLAVILLIFGAKRLPDTARGLGRSLRILKAETRGLRDDDNDATPPPPPPAPAPPAVLPTPNPPSTSTPDAGARKAPGDTAGS